MSQVKIYGLRTTLAPLRKALSDVIHQCIVEALKFPADKRFHRFILLDKEDFYFPTDRTDHYLIIELMMMSGRSVETKKKLIRLLFQEISKHLNISTNDIEICILESPACNWGFRGKPGDELSLSYSVEV
jgi:phenylpyruvate tautomerase PptA (4-oxalocrotonate tautomerase family)